MKNINAGFQYIGITDFMTRKQVAEVVNLYFLNMNILDPMRLHVGVTMSHKTLNGLRTRFTDVFPKKEDVAVIFMRHPLTFNVLHYADYEGVDVLNNIMLATQYGGPEMDAIQLDMIWPDPEDIRIYREQFPDTKIILQINEQALNAVNNDPQLLVIRLSLYGKNIDYVLLDKSMGEGKGLDANVLLPFLREIRDILPHLCLAVAGGLGPGSLKLVAPILSEFPCISMDAQSRLRPSHNKLDPLDLNMAIDYFLEALNMVQERKKLV